jgi:hypothetical protein
VSDFPFVFSQQGQTIFFANKSFPRNKQINSMYDFKPVSINFRFIAKIMTTNRSIQTLTVSVGYGQVGAISRQAL